VTDDARTTGPGRDWCGTMPVHRRLLDSDPTYAQARQDIENFTFDMTLAGPEPLASVGTAPVGGHFGPHDDGGDISDEQVASQIDVLNRDFRKRNPDTADVPSVFASRVADARIEFTLADVTRTRTDRDSFDTDDAVKSAATGGADAVDPATHLNVWVCTLSSGLLGYAQFPGGPPDTDGVVITHTAFGTTGTAADPFNGGRTATHEIGHWLNLRHIWGDDGDGCSGDDFVADTPNQAGPNYGKPSWPSVSCGNTPDGDMFMNYMDYTDDAAMFMFTNGQATRMQVALTGPRSGLLSAGTLSG
jgi:hypothetical protein